MTERLRILIRISNNFQTLEIMEKILSDKNEPIRGPLLFEIVYQVHTKLRLGTHIPGNLLQKNSSFWANDFAAKVA